MGYRYVMVLTSILILFLPLGIVQGSISHPHWSPGAPLEGTNIDLFVLIVREDLSNISEVRASIDGTYYPMAINTDLDDENVSGLFQGSVNFGSSGDINVTIQVLIDGKWIDEGSFMITVGEKNDDEEDTIFGLPKLYCSISIIILTIIVIFFTWSYFKGRSMQKTEERDTGRIKVECSDCGKPIGNNERSCPWCGIELEEEEYICGKCSKTVSSKDEICPFCDASLLTGPSKERMMDEISNKKSINGNPRQKRKMDKKGKRTCKECGTVLMIDEKACPVCNKE